MDLCRPKQWKVISASQLLETGFPVYGANGKIGFYSEFTHEYPTLMITCRGATCGNIHISDAKSYINGNAMALDSLDKSKSDIRYLYHYLLSRGFSDVISGSAQPQITRQGLEKVTIPLPPLAEQRRIAAILDKADAIRRKRQKAIALTDTLLKSVFLDMFGDPVTNPMGWEVKQISKIAELINGDRSSNYPSGPDLVETGILFLNTKNISKNKVNFDTLTFITEEKFEQLTRGKAEQGDLIITLRGSLASCCIFEGPYPRAFINAQMMIIRPDLVKIEAGYLHSILTFPSMNVYLKSIGSGSAIPQLTAKQIGNVLVPLPPLSLRKKYSKIKGLILNNSRENKAALKGSRALAASLTQRAFRGELTATDCKTIEAAQ